MADSWKTRFDETWLSSNQACQAIDTKVALLVGKHWGRRGAAAAPRLVLSTRCTEAANAIASIGPTPSHAIHCTTILSLLAELLLCAEDGGIFREEIIDQFAGGVGERRATAESLRLLRNATCHPAAATSGDGEIAIVALARYVANAYREERWAVRLQTQPEQAGLLADREVTFFALRLVNTLGWWQADHWGLSLKGAKPPWPRRKSST